MSDETMPVNANATLPVGEEDAITVPVVNGANGQIESRFAAWWILRFIGATAAWSLNFASTIGVSYVLVNDSTGTGTISARALSSSSITLAPGEISEIMTLLDPATNSIEFRKISSNVPGSGGNSIWFETLAAMAASAGTPSKSEAEQLETSAPYEFLPGDTSAVDGWSVLANTGGTAGRWILKGSFVSVGATVNDQGARLTQASAGLVGKNINLRGETFPVSTPASFTSPVWITGVASTRVRSTVVPAGPATDSAFVLEQILSGNNGTLAISAKVLGTGLSAVVSAGTAPVITLSGVPTQLVKGFFIRVTLAGALTVWTGEYSIDGINWVAFTSAAAVVAGATGVTINIAAGNAGLNGTWASQGPRSLALTFGVMPIAGNAIQVLHNSGGASGTSQALYDIVAVVGSSVVVDRPLVWPFVAGDSVQVLSSYPKRDLIDGHGMQFSGTGIQSVIVIAGKRSKILGCDYVSGASNLTASALGLDCSCQEGLIADFNIDQPNGSSSVYLQSNERSLIRDGVARNSGYSYALYDCYMCGVEDCWSYGTTVGGIIVQKVDATTFGSSKCWIRGGGTLNCNGTGVLLDTTSLCSVTDHVVDGAVIGFSITGATFSTLSNIRAFNCSSIGLIVNSPSADTLIDNFVASRCGTGLRVNTGSTRTYVTNTSISTCADFLVRSTGGDLTIVNLAGVVGASDTVAPILIDAGNFTLVNSRITCQAASSKVIESDAGVTRLTNVQIDLSVGANQTGVTLIGTVAFVENLKVTGIGSSIGIRARVASTLWLGDGCDFSTCGTPVLIDAGSGCSQGILTLNGANAVDITFPDAQATDKLQLDLKTVHGTQGPPPNYTVTAGTKFTVFGTALDLSDYSYKVVRPQQ